MAKINLNNYQTFPMIVLGEAIVDFKKMCKSPIIRVENLSELREVVVYYSSVSYLDRILVIEDLSFLSSQAEGILLKFVEETKLRVVLLSYYDVVSKVILSRCKTVVKRQKDKTTSKFLSIADGNKQLEEYFEKHDSPYYTRVKMQGEVCPKVYYLEKLLGNRQNKSKIMALLE